MTNFGRYYSLLQSMDEPVTIPEFAQQVEIAVVDWYMNEGQYIFADVANSATMYAQNKVVPFVMPLVAADKNWHLNLTYEQQAVVRDFSMQVMAAAQKMVRKDVVASQWKDAQIAMILSVIPFMSLNSANYMDFDWASVDWAGIGDFAHIE